MYVSLAHYLCSKVWKGMGNILTLYCVHGLRTLLVLQGIPPNALHILPCTIFIEYIMLATTMGTLLGSIALTSCTLFTLLHKEFHHAL